MDAYTLKRLYIQAKRGRVRVSSGKDFASKGMVYHQPMANRYIHELPTNEPEHKPKTKVSLTKELESINRPILSTATMSRRLPKI